MTYADDLALARQLADLADPISMGYFRGEDLGTEFKADGSPVTRADKEVERTLRAALAEARPRDGIVGEEYGADGSADRRWIIDPIDGTAHFAGGRTEWSTLIGLDVAGVVRVGMVSAPALGRRWWGVAGDGAWTAPAGGEPERLSVGGTSSVAECSVAMWPVGRRLDERKARVAYALRDACGVLRPTPEEGTSLRDASGNVHGGLLVAEGVLDAYVLLGGGPWDHAAVVPVVEAAGGRYSDLDGGTRVDLAAGVYTNGRVHEGILALVNEALRG